MKKIWVKISLALIVITVELPCWANNPCQSIAQACMQAGYQRGAQVGKRLIKDCVIPITKKQKTLANTSFPDDTLQQCSAFVAERMGG